MEYVQLGKSDLKVSKICLGCMSFGEVTNKRKWVLNQEQTDEMIKRALELGINFFDTANTYGDGSSETFIGNSFKKFVKNRKDIIVATKVYNNEGKLSKEAILREIDKEIMLNTLDNELSHFLHIHLMLPLFLLLDVHNPIYELCINQHNPFEVFLNFHLFLLILLLLITSLY